MHQFINYSYILININTVFEYDKVFLFFKYYFKNYHHHIIIIIGNFCVAFKNHRILRFTTIEGHSLRSVDLKFVWE